LTIELSRDSLNTSEAEANNTGPEDDLVDAAAADLCRSMTEPVEHCFFGGGDLSGSNKLCFAFRCVAAGVVDILEYIFSQ
jgi:hypothetical protein